MMIQGNAWVFGTDISTDAIVPSVYLTRYLAPEKLKEIAMEGVRPGFCRRFRPGDLFVAGGNFGCGSSREEAPLALKALGVAVVVADSFGRIFYRNAINVGLPVVACPGISKQVEEGDRLEVDVETGMVKIEKSGIRLEGERKPEFCWISCARGDCWNICGRPFWQAMKLMTGAFRSFDFSRDHQNHAKESLCRQRQPGCASFWPEIKS